MDHAAVDFSGDFLKLALRDTSAFHLVTALLEELGYRTEIASQVDAGAVDAWYDTSSVVELSRVEAGVIADRIVPPLAHTQSLSAALSAVEEQVRPILGANSAKALARLVNLDMSEDHRGRERA